MICPYRMIVTSKDADKVPIVVWHCRHEDGHEGWHSPAESRREIVDAYELKSRADEIVLEPAEVLSVGWSEPDALTRQSKLGKLYHDYLKPLGWESHLGKAKHYTGETYVKSSGSIKPGKVEELVWIDAVHRESKRRLTATKDGITVNGKTTEVEEL